MNILFSGAVFHPEWKGGEPVIGKELIKFLSKRHTCRVSKSLPFTIDKARSILRFIEKDYFVISEILQRSDISKSDLVLSFYDFDSSIMRQCIKRKVPIVVTQHIYWGLCPKFDLWNNVFNCSCSIVEPYSRDCKKCLSRQGNLGPQIVSSLFSANLINSLRNNRKLYFSKCNALIVPSNYMATLYKKELGMDEVRVVHNGIDTKFYKPMRRDSQGKKKQILYAGARTYTKGYHHFVKLASEITKLRDDVEFVAFGYGKGSSHNCVRDLGYLSKPAVPQAYSDSYILIFPALWDEPFAQIPLESMACGCPVLAYASGGVSEMIKDGHSGGLVPTGDFNQLLEKTLDLIDNESKNSNMRVLSRQYIQEKFPLSVMLNKYEKILLEFA